MNTSYNCFVSVITPLHNKGGYIEETIKSVLSQTFANWEMIVVENGSSDNGPDIVRTFVDPRISFLISETVGPSAARNLGLDHATGDWVLFLDADDLLESNYLKERHETTKRSPNADIIFGTWREFSETNINTGATQYPIGWETDGKDLKTMSFAYVCWPPLCAIIKRSVITDNKRWPVEMDSLGAEDNGFWFSLLYQAQIAWSANGSALYRKSTTNSRDVWAQAESRRFAICQATISRNTEFLKNIGQIPNSQMSAAAFRLLRSVWRDVSEDNPSLKNEAFTHMCKHIRNTSFLELRMLACRVAIFTHHSHLKQRLTSHIAWRVFQRPLIYAKRLPLWLAGMYFDIFEKEYCVGDLKFTFPITATSRYDRGHAWIHGFELPERSLVTECMPASSTVLELGGGVGVVSCVTNKRLTLPKHHVVVEANPLVVPYLNRNRDVNHCMFSIENCNISEKSKVTFYVNQSTVLSSINRPTGIRVECEGKTIEDLESKYGMAFDFLVMDIEGAEYDIVMQNARYIGCNIRGIILERHPDLLSDLKIREYETILTGLGFTKIKTLGSVDYFQKAV